MDEFDRTREELRRAVWWLETWHRFGALRFAPEHLREASRRTRAHVVRARDRIDWLTR